MWAMVESKTVVRLKTLATECGFSVEPPWRRISLSWAWRERGRGRGHGLKRVN